MKVKGFQVAPAELEGCLLDHPDVSNACVVGVPDDYSPSLLFLLPIVYVLIEYRMAGGDVPLAFVVLSSDASKRVEMDRGAVEVIKASIIQVRFLLLHLLSLSRSDARIFVNNQHVASTKVHYKHLAGGVEIVPSIPTSPSGKLLRRILRDQSNEMMAKRAKAKAIKPKL